MDVCLFEKSIKYKACYNRFVNGVSWEETGIYEYYIGLLQHSNGMDGIYSLADVVERYKRVDDLFEEVRLERRLKTRAELHGNAFREHGGVFVHVGRSGSLIFGLGGYHRLSIAKILGIDEIPAQIGMVHASVVEKWSNYVKRDEIFLGKCAEIYKKSLNLKEV